MILNIPDGLATQPYIYKRNARQLYGVIVPATVSARRIATSKKPPHIMIGDGTDEEIEQWATLRKRAAAWRIPSDRLLIGRPITLAVQEAQIWDAGHYTPALILLAIRIGGDLRDDPAFDAVREMLR